MRDVTFQLLTDALTLVGVGAIAVLWAHGVALLDPPVRVALADGHIAVLGANAGSGVVRLVVHSSLALLVAQLLSVRALGWVTLLAKWQFTVRPRGAYAAQTAEELLFMRAIERTLSIYDNSVIRRMPATYRFADLLARWLDTVYVLYVLSLLGWSAAVCFSAPATATVLSAALACLEAYLGCALHYAVRRVEWDTRQRAQRLLKRAYRALYAFVSFSIGFWIVTCVRTALPLPPPPPAVATLVGVLAAPFLEFMAAMCVAAVNFEMGAQAACAVLLLELALARAATPFVFFGLLGTELVCIVCLYLMYNYRLNESNMSTTSSTINDA